MQTALTIADAWGMHDVGTGWTILMVVFWSMVLVGLVWFARRGLGDLAPREPEAPLDTLARRLAEGSISTEEYLQTRELLTDNDGAGRVTTPRNEA